MLFKMLSYLLLMALGISPRSSFGMCEQSVASNKGNVPFYSDALKDPEQGVIETNKHAAEVGVLDPVDNGCADMHETSGVTHPDYFYDPGRYREVLRNTVRELLSDPHALDRLPKQSGERFSAVYHALRRDPQPPPGQIPRVLVVGSNIGREIAWLLDRPTRTPFEIVGIDHCQEACTIASSRFAANKNVKIIKHSVLEMDPNLVTDESFDIVYLMFSTIFEFRHGIDTDEKSALFRALFPKMRKPGLLIVDIRTDLGITPIEETVNGTTLRGWPITVKGLIEIGLTAGFRVYHEPHSYKLDRPRTQIYFTRLP